MDLSRLADSGRVGSSTPFPLYRLAVPEIPCGAFPMNRDSVPHVPCAVPEIPWVESGLMGVTKGVKRVLLGRKLAVSVLFRHVTPASSRCRGKASGEAAQSSGESSGVSAALPSPCMIH